MQSMPAWGIVAMMGDAQCGEDNGSHRRIFFNKMKTGYWLKGLEGADLAAMVPGQNYSYSRRVEHRENKK